MPVPGNTGRTHGEAIDAGGFFSIQLWLRPACLYPAKARSLDFAEYRHVVKIEFWHLQSSCSHASNNI